MTFFISYLSHGARDFLFQWQSFVGAIIGASVPFLLWWWTEIYRRRKTRKETLYYIEKVLVDQINSLKDTRRVIKLFIDERLDVFIRTIKDFEDETYCIGQIFLPLFSVRSFDDKVHDMTTESGYLDNKIAECYALSKDMPFIIDDFRQQLAYTHQNNRDLSISKLNPARVQRDFYVKHLSDFRESIKVDMMDKNFPLYFEKLAQLKVALTTLRKIKKWRWRIKFDPAFRFYWTQQDYEKARTNSYEAIEEYFAPETAKFIAEMIEAS